MKGILRLAILATLLSFFVYGCGSTDDEATDADGASDVSTDVDDEGAAASQDNDDDGDLGSSDGDIMDLAVFQNADGEIICPVMGSRTSAEKAVGYQDYEGTRYYFCCGDCPEDFAADPEKYALAQ